MTALAFQLFAPDDARRVLAFPRCPTAERMAATRELDGEERLTLERLRWLALRSQLKPRGDPEKACHLLAGEPDASLDRYATAFFRGLSASATSHMVFYKPGAASVSDDENWLMRLVAASRRGEDAGAGALVSWRVRAPARRWMRFLAHGMVRALDAS